jgi:hypothetical protein
MCIGNSFSCFICPFVFDTGGMPSSLLLLSYNSPSLPPSFPPSLLPSLPPSLPPPLGTAQTAWEKSCYFKIDFKITEDAMMYEAVQR